MLKLMMCICAAAMTALIAGAAPAEIINIKQPPYAAVGDGQADDRPALQRALDSAKAGDLVMIPPGQYRIELTGGAMVVPSGVTIWGLSGESIFTLTSDAGGQQHCEFLRPGSDVALVGLTIRREADFPAVLLPIFGDAERITLRDCRIVGNKAKFPAYCHALQVGVGTVKGLTLDGVEIINCEYGLFGANQATGTLDGVLVERCRFAENTASDLEFNAPRGAMRNITVRDCTFIDNQCKTAAGGFAVGFANVARGRVEHCRITNYGSEALHVEDRSTDIELVDNTIVGGSTAQPNGVILVVNNAKAITIARNLIDARPNANNPHLILVTAGGTHFANPSDVRIVDNVLVNGPATRTWYLQEGSGPEPTGNRIVDQPAAP